MPSNSGFGRDSKISQVNVEILVCFNSDSKEGWWFKINELQEKFTRPTPNSTSKNRVLEHRYRLTRALRADILLANQQATPITESKINALIDLDELAAVDNFQSNKQKSKNPDEAITGQFLEEQVVEVLAHNGIFTQLKIFDEFSPSEDVEISFGDLQVLYSEF